MIQNTEKALIRKSGFTYLFLIKKVLMKLIDMLLFFILVNFFYEVLIPTTNKTLIRNYLLVSNKESSYFKNYVTFFIIVNFLYKMIDPKIITLLNFNLFITLIFSKYF